jgi:hypothetical protein
MLLGIMIGSNVMAANVRQADQIFSSWVDEKSVYFQYCIADVKPNFSPAVARPVKIFKPMECVTEPLQKLIMEDDGVTVDKRKLKNLRRQVIQSMPNFLKTLEQAGLKSVELNALDSKGAFANILNRYTGLFGALFTDTPKKASVEQEFAIANRFVEFCFAPRTFKHLQKILREDATKPVGRFLYAGMWQKLAGQGWKFWHRETLKRLRYSYQQGKTIVYVAGGSDIYQLLAHGVYNIKVIDPQLAGAQDNYYATDWRWLLKSDGIGDEFHLNNANGKKITAKRACVEAGTTFSVVSDAGEKIKQRSDKVVWNIFEDGESKGNLTFERRLASQQDFMPADNEELLMSFNELYFIAAPENLGGWPIDWRKFSATTKLHVKQLRKPVSKKMVENMAWVEEKGLAFLRLGTAVK